MALTRNPIYNKEFFNKGVLIPFWAIQWLLELTLMIFCIMRFFTVAPARYWEPRGYDNVGSYVAGGVLASAIIFAALRVHEVVFYAKQRLSPAGYFAIEFSQFIIFTAVMSTATVFCGTFFDSDVLMMSGVYALNCFYMGTFIYSCVIFDRYRKWLLKKQILGTYAPESESPPRPISAFARVEVSPRHSILTGDCASYKDIEVESILPAYEEEDTLSRKHPAIRGKKLSNKGRSDDRKVGYGYN